MKIEQKESVFNPVVITLETQEEVDQMYALADWLRFSAGENKDITLSIKQKLGTLVENYYAITNLENNPTLLKIKENK